MHQTAQRQHPNSARAELPRALFRHVSSGGLRLALAARASFCVLCATVYGATRVCCSERCDADGSTSPHSFPSISRFETEKRERASGIPIYLYYYYHRQSPKRQQSQRPKRTTRPQRPGQQCQHDAEKRGTLTRHTTTATHTHKHSHISSTSRGRERASERASDACGVVNNI